MNILVTGGAGYVGSVVAESLLQQKYEVIVLDNLQQGHRKAVLPEAKFVLADIRDKQALTDTFKAYTIDAVMHMAAETVVEFSMTDPARYFQNNIIGGINLLDTMVKNKVDKFIFSSTAAVYGEPVKIPINEDHPKNPINSYGESKLMFENILKWYKSAYGLQYVTFRYFCAAGAGDSVGEDHRPETHLIPNVLKVAMNQKGSILIFGNDYATKDGSCIRDFVHVKDIASAHILALNKLDSLNGEVFNLGNSQGYSVFEVIKTAERVTGERVPVQISSRRAGDPAVLIAGSEKARTKLGWQPQHSDLTSIISNAWKWEKANIANIR